MSSERPPVALSIAGSDPTGAAGLQLDMRVFERHGVHGMAVPTAITIQTSKGVHQVLPTFPSVVGDQLHLLLGDILPDAIKIGMLATDDVAIRVANVLERYDVPRVIDPVLRASDGTLLLEQRALRNLVERLIDGCALVTPNLDEAERLTGLRDPEAAADALLELGAAAALVKGGHADGPPDDFLATADARVWISGERIPLRDANGGDAHGTGCALSSAIAARLARGEALEPAVRGAKAFVANAIGGAYRAGQGAQHWLRLEDA